MVLFTRSTSSTLPRRHLPLGGEKISQPKTPTRCASTGRAQHSVSQTQATLRAVSTPCESVGSELPPHKTPTDTAHAVKSKTKGSRHACGKDVISPLDSTSSNRHPSRRSPKGQSLMKVDTVTINAQTGQNGSRKRRISGGASFYSDVIEKQRLQQRQTRGVRENGTGNAEAMEIHGVIRAKMAVISVHITRLTIATNLCISMVMFALVSSVYQIGMGLKECFTH